MFNTVFIEDGNLIIIYTQNYFHFQRYNNVLRELYYE